MIVVHYNHNRRLMQTYLAVGHKLPEKTVWVDLIHPTFEEEVYIEQYFHINVPTERESEKIAMLNKFYRDHDKLFMTVRLVNATAPGEFTTETLNVILVDSMLITCHRNSLTLFDQCLSILNLTEESIINGHEMLSRLLGYIISKEADIMDCISDQLEKIYEDIFPTSHKNPASSAILHRTLEELGQAGEVSNRINESLRSFNRLVSFYQNYFPEGTHLPQKFEERGLKMEIGSLQEFNTFIAQEINFLLSATLGLINVEQNNIIKIFSVAAVIFLPPTLIASIYGMNFQYLPELQLPYGYPLALFLMLLSAVIPYCFFKLKRWL